MVSDFWITGVGVGAYERAMTVYQRQPHVFYFNHAHNEYLQLLAEGGVVTSSRDDNLRISAHCYNTAEDVSTALDLLARNRSLLRLD